jgi:hypothetical protein
MCVVGTKIVFIFRVKLAKTADIRGFLDNLVKWISGKNVFTKEKAMIINFG